MTRSTMLISAVALVAGLAASAQAVDPVIVFDDTYHAPFKGYWANQIVDDTVIPPHSGTHSLRRGSGTDGNGAIIETLTEGFMYGETNILDVWVNSPEPFPMIGNLTVIMKDNTRHEMGNRGPGVTWIVDGVEVTGQDVLLDTDPNTWQHVQFDISQTYYKWDEATHGDVPANVPSDQPINKIEIRGAGSGTMAPYVDDFMFIAPPSEGCHMGDANGDGQVGIADLTSLAENYGENGDHVTWLMGDFNDDKIVGIADLTALAENYGWEGDVCDPGGGTVPEPITMSLLAVGGLALVRRRK